MIIISVMAKGSGLQVRVNDEDGTDADIIDWETIADYVRPYLIKDNDNDQN